MAFAINWDLEGERTFETGVDHGVLYPYSVDGVTIGGDAKHYAPGVAWNGLTGVNETHEGGEPEDLWADNIKYLSLMSAESLGITITAYTYPDEFAECDGSAELLANMGVTFGQQTRKRFGFSYRTRYGNDTEGDGYGYKLHLVYGCMAAPSDKDYSTVNDSPEAIEFSWDVNTTPAEITKVNGAKPTASIVIDSKACPQAKLAKIEAILYGTEATGSDGVATPGYLPMPDEIYEILSAVEPGT